MPLCVRENDVGDEEMSWARLRSTTASLRSSESLLTLQEKLPCGVEQQEWCGCIVGLVFL